MKNLQGQSASANTVDATDAENPHLAMANSLLASLAAQTDGLLGTANETENVSNDTDASKAKSDKEELKNVDDTSLEQSEDCESTDDTKNNCEKNDAPV